MHPLEYSLLSNNIHDYRIVSQGKTTIPGVDDGDGFEETDVRIGTYFNCEFAVRPLVLYIVFCVFLTITCANPDLIKFSWNFTLYV